MMKIEAVSSQPDRAGRYKVQFSDGTARRLYRQTIEDFTLYAGRELESKEFSALLEAAGEMSAKMRAVRIISASSVSKKDLEQRLIHKGEDIQHAKQAVAWMSEMDLLDDSKTAEQVIHRCISRGYGINRAKQMLYEKRIPKEYWDDALSDYPDQHEWIRSFLCSRLDECRDEKQIRKAIDALLRKGHPYGVIRSVMSKLSFDDAFLEE
jgi:regulatory protein